MTNPPFQRSLQSQAVATGLTFGVNNYIGAAYGAGQIAATVSGVGTNYFVQWPNAYDLSTFRQLTLPDTGTRANSVVYDGINKCFYAGVFITTNGVPHKAVTIYKLTLDGVVTRLANAVDIGLNPSTQIAYSQIETDGSFIYIALAANSGNNSTMVKLSCVDGSLVTAISIGSSPSTTTSLANFIRLVTPTTLIVGGSSTGLATPWFAQVPTSLGSITSVIDSSLGVACSNQVAAVGGNLWVPERVVGTNVLKVAGDLSSVTPFPQGSPPENSSGAWYDGATLWLLANSSDIIGINPSTGAIVASHPELATVAAADLGLFVVALPGAFAALAAAGLAMLLPTGDTSAKPHLLGHGAC